MVKSNFCPENGLSLTVKYTTVLPMHFFPPSVTGKLSSALLRSIWNRSHICFIPLLKTDHFSKYASLTGAAVCHITCTQSKLHKSSNTLLNCCSTWGSSNDTGTPQSYFGLSMRSVSGVLSLQAVRFFFPLPLASPTTPFEIWKSCSIISCSCITTSSEDHASQLKSMQYHHNHEAFSVIAEVQLIKAKERRFHLILSCVGSAGLTRQKAGNALLNEVNRYECKQTRNVIWSKTAQ